MGNMLSAGILVREFDTTNVVPSVSVSEGGVVIAAQWGPVDQLTLVDSENTLVSTFWTPNSTVANDWFTAANFLAYANKLWIVRVVDESNANTSLRATNSTASLNSGILVKNDDHYNLNYSNGELDTNFSTGPWVARYPGALGNSLRVSVCPSSSAFQSNLSGTITVSANSVALTGTNTAFDTELTVGDLLIINGETHKLASVTNSTVATLGTRHVTGATANTAVRRWEYYNEVTTAPGTSDWVSTRGGSSDELHVVVVDEDGLLTKQSGTILEVFEKLSKANDAQTDNGTANYYKEAINQRSKWIRWAGHPSGITGAGSSSAGTTFGTPATPLNASLIGGSDGAAVGNDEKINGYSFFLNKEDVEVSILLGSDATQTVATYIINDICEVRQDCFGFFSPPKSYVVNNAGNELDDVVAYRNTLPVTSYAALDSGWKWQYDRYNDLYRYVPLNGDIGGLHVQTDTTRDPWWAAAGFNRGQIKNVIKLSWNPKQADRDILYKNNINPVATFPGDGTVLFGQKTLLSKPSAFDRINVRRLFIVLEKAISKAAKYQLFEFNDSFTQAQFKNMVEPYLRDVQGRRGIYDFRVICDDTNNTPEVVDRNEFVGTILVKPERVAEFITLNFVAVRTGVDFTEIAGKFGG